MLGEAVNNVPDGFEVDPQVLSEAANEISRCVRPAQGTDLNAIPGGSATCGHPGVSEALAHFCTTWELATLLLVARADSRQRGLVEQAGDYTRTDFAAADRLVRLPPE